MLKQAWVPSHQGHRLSPALTSKKTFAPTKRNMLSWALPIPNNRQWTHMQEEVKVQPKTTQTKSACLLKSGTWMYRVLFEKQTMVFPTRSPCANWSLHLTWELSVKQNLFHFQVRNERKSNRRGLEDGEPRNTTNNYAKLSVLLGDLPRSRLLLKNRLESRNIWRSSSQLMLN